jgi:hypothetical protein
MLHTWVEKLWFAINHSQLKLTFVIVIVPSDNCKQHVLVASDIFNCKQLVANNNFCTSGIIFPKIIILPMKKSTHTIHFWLCLIHNN